MIKPASVRPDGSATLAEYIQRPQASPPATLLACPFCGGKAVEYIGGEIDLDCFPSGKAVMCANGCWIDGIGIDFEAWQSR